MSYFSNTFEYDPIDDLNEREHLITMMMEDPKALWDACSHYLNWRPDRERELATAYFKAHK